MSQTGAPVKPKKKNPVGAQEVSTGDEINPPALDKAKSDQLHEVALRDETPNREELEKAVQQALREKFEVTDAWKPKQVIKFIIECPSGQSVLVKHLDTLDLIRADLIEELDFFTKSLMPQNIDAAGNLIEKEAEVGGVWAMLRDPEKRRRFFDLTNRLMSTASIKPKIVNDGVALRTLENGSKIDVFGHEIVSIDEQIELFGKPIPVLKEGECYAGPIDFSDRMTIFQELNKPLEAIHPFREGSDALLADLEPVQIVELPSE